MRLYSGEQRSIPNATLGGLDFREKLYLLAAVLLQCFLRHRKMEKIRTLYMKLIRLEVLEAAIADTAPGAEPLPN